MVIKKNGNYALKPLEETRSGTSIVYVSGDLGGAVAVISYKTLAGVIEPYVDGVVIIGEQYKVEHGIGVDLFLHVTGVSPTTVITTVTARL